MQPLVTIEQHNIAQLFADYLTAQAIANRVEKDVNGYTIYCEQAKFAQAHQLFTEFIKQPFHPKYQQNAWQQGKLIATEQQTNPVAELWQKFSQHGGIVSHSIFALCWLVFIASFVLGYANQIFVTMRFADLTEQAWYQDIWRLVTPALFHFSWLHLVFNTMWWWQLAGDIEQKLGRNGLLQLTLVAAIIPNVAQYYASGNNFGGLSAVVYALVGFVAVMAWRAPQLKLTIAKPILVFLLLWMALGFIDLLPVNMANAAHLAGFVVGCIWAMVVSLPTKNASKH